MTYADNTGRDFLNGSQRGKYGCIVSFKSADGSRLTLHRTGPIRAAIKQACAIALARDDTYRVVAVSTPTTIHRDLQGTRRNDYAGVNEGPERRFNLPEFTSIPAELLHDDLRVLRGTSRVNGRRS